MSFPQLPSGLAGLLTDLREFVAAVRFTGRLARYNHREAQSPAESPSMNAEPTAPAGMPAPAPVPPELLEWARQTFDAREFLEGVREIEATGGAPLESFIGEIEAVVRGS